MVPAWRLPGVLVVAGAVLVWAALIRAQPSDTPASQSIEALLAAKAQRTPAQRKLSSHLLDAWRAVQDQSAVDALVTVDIRADVTPAVLERIQTLGGTVLNSVPQIPGHPGTPAPLRPGAACHARRRAVGPPRRPSPDARSKPDGLKAPLHR